MPMNEACAVWVEQEIQEAVENGGDVAKSFLAVSREIQADILKRFETLVSTETLRKKIAKAAAGMIAQDPENPATTPAEGGCTGCKLDPVQVVAKINKMVGQGRSIREASEVIAQETGKKPSAVRSAYAREREKLAPEDAPSEAWQFVEIAILQLRRIRRDDPGRKEAFQKIKDWIASQEVE